MSENVSVNPFDKLAKRMDVCKRCENKKCKKGLFGSPIPNDCPFQLEKIMTEEDIKDNEKR